MSREKSIKIEGYEGEVLIRPMRNIEKFDLMQSLGFDSESLTALSRKKKVTNKDVNLDLNSMRSMFEKAKSLVIKVDLKQDDVHYQSWDDLDFDPKALPIQMELVNYAIGMGK